MDLSMVNAAVGLKQAQVSSQIDYAVAGKILDNDRASGAAALKLIDAASSGFAKAGDALVASATGLGGEVDTYA